jgi:hypothetical protein
MLTTIRQSGGSPKDEHVSVDAMKARPESGKAGREGRGGRISGQAACRAPAEVVTRY